MTWPLAISDDMVRLSVNVNKVATLRNSRGGRVPSVVEAADVCVAAGAPGITVHPRADRRHITPNLSAGHEPWCAAKWQMKDNVGLFRRSSP